MTPSTSPPRLGALRRAVSIVVGSLMSLTGFGVAALLLWLFWNSASTRGLAARDAPLAILIGFGTVTLFMAFAAMGARRVVRGIRSDPAEPRPFGAGLEVILRRHWYPVGLLASFTLSLADVAASGGIEPFVAGARPSVHRGALFALLALLVLPAHVALHEAGHALAARLVGLRFVSLHVGSVELRRVGDRLRVRWATLDIPDVLGFHAALPTASPASRWSRAVHALGGPTATLAGVLAAAAAPSLLPRPSGVGATLLDHLLVTAVWVGVFLELSSVVPFRTRSGLLTDGALIVRNLWPETPVRRAVRLFEENWWAGRRPRDWGIPASVFLDAARLDATSKNALLLAAATVLIDTGAKGRAAEILRDALAAPRDGAPVQVLELELQVVMLDAFDGRVADAAARLDRIGAAPSLSPYARLARAAVAAMSGRTQEAADALDEWERAIADTGRAAAIRVGNEWAVDELRARLAASRQIEQQQ
jgi:hypothetical protein